MNDTALRRALDGFRWEKVEPMRYKPEADAPFRDVSRQVLFDNVPQGTQWRYFEVAPGGHTTLERHQHPHAVLVLRGRGHCLVGDTVLALSLHDLIEVAPGQWHQFRAGQDDPLGFLCLVDAGRDRPELPDAQALAALRRKPAIARFLDGA